jgi:LDH2 family malate/lactate/ureidoglycolate dehydrogenase
VRGPGASGGGSAFFWVINPTLVNGRSTFDALIGDWVKHYLDHAGEVARLPGRRAAVAEQLALHEGLEIDQAIETRLRVLGERLALSWPEPIAPIG